MLNLFFKSKHDNKVVKVNKLMKGSWIYVENPTESEIDALVNSYSLERGHLADALDPYEVPRYEDEDGFKYFFIRYPSVKDTKVYTIPLLIIIADDFFVTICRERLTILDSLKVNPSFSTTQKTKAFIQILLLVNKEFKIRINSISKEVRNAGMSLERIENKDIIEFVEYERMLEDFLSSLLPTNLILDNILYGKILRLYEEDADLLEDVALSNVQLTELSKSLVKHIVNTRDAYNTIMTNNLNKTMRLLTSLTIILTIPTIISSFYGMNVILPMQDNPLMFVFILFITLGISAVLLYVFFKNKLL